MDAAPGTHSRVTGAQEYKAMKITESELRRIIHQEVQSLNEMPRRSTTRPPSIAAKNKRIALAAANEVIELMQEIKDKLQDVFQDDDQWMEVESHIDAAAGLVVQKQNELTTDPMKKAQVMDWSGV